MFYMLNPLFDIFLNLCFEKGGTGPPNPPTGCAGGGGHSFLTFFKRIIFFGRTILKLIEKQERLQIFENLHAAMAIFVLFE